TTSSRCTRSGTSGSRYRVMSLALLRQLLADARLSPANVRPLVDASNAWYQADPNAASFAVRALFRELSARGWEEQGVPAAELVALEADLLPPLNDLLESLESGGKGVMDALDVLAKACRDHFG